MAGEGIGISERVAQVTIAKWATMVSEQTTQKLPLLGLLKKKGRIQYGCHGGEYRWVVRYRDHELGSFIDGDEQDFVRVNTKFNANLPWSAYSVKDAITKREKMENGGKEAIIKVFKNREEVMRRSAVRRLASEFYKDGNLAANSALEKFHGIESFCSISTQTNTDALATTHDDSYAGQSTAVGAAGVDPDSEGVWTPTIVNCDRVVSGSTRAWADYGDEYLRKANIETSYGSAPEENLDLFLLTKSAYEDLLNILDDKERIQVTRGSALALTKLGFEDVIQIDGRAVMWDHAMPANDGTTLGGSNSDNSGSGVTLYGYGFNTSRLKLLLLNSKQLWESDVRFNDTYQADRIFMSLVGQLCFESPRHFAKLAAISS